MPLNVLRAPLGRSLVLVRPEHTRLLLLNPVEAWIFEAQVTGLSEQESALALAGRFGKFEADTLADVRRTRQWLDLECHAEIPAGRPIEASRHSGDPCRNDGVFLNSEPEVSSNCVTWRLALADRTVALHIDDTKLASVVACLVEHFPAWSSEPCGHTLRLTGSPVAWSIYVDGQWRGSGAGFDEATVELAGALMDLGAGITERLLVLHAAGLVSPDGIGLALIGPGGAGKSTLAAALNGDGYALLSDDVVPVTPGGELVGLGTSLCIKAGSWEVLASRSAALSSARSVSRFGEPARFIPPLRFHVGSPVPTDLLLFPRYDPLSLPAAQWLTPEETLQRIVEAQSLIRDMDQQKLDTLVNWVASVPAYALVYPDLDSALRLVREQVATVHAARQTAEC